MASAQRCSLQCDLSVWKIRNSLPVQRVVWVPARESVIPRLAPASLLLCLENGRKYDAPFGVMGKTGDKGDKKQSCLAYSWCLAVRHVNLRWRTSLCPWGLSFRSQERETLLPLAKLRREGCPAMGWGRLSLDRVGVR